MLLEANSKENTSTKHSLGIQAPVDGYGENSIKDIYYDFKFSLIVFLDHFANDFSYVWIKQ